MLQHIVIIIILVGCAWYVGRRFYNNFSNSHKDCGCGCSCSGCGPDVRATCHPSELKSDPK